MVVTVSTAGLSTQINRIEKTKYFSVELQAVDMYPITQYDVYVDGVKVNAFCKPFGGNLGDPLISGIDGKLLVQYHMAIPYNNKYLTINQDINGYMAKSKVIEFRDANGNSSQTYLPIRIKASS